MELNSKLTRGVQPGTYFVPGQVDSGVGFAVSLGWPAAVSDHTGDMASSGGRPLLGCVWDSCWRLWLDGCGPHLKVPRHFALGQAVNKHSVYTRWASVGGF